MRRVLEIGAPRFWHDESDASTYFVQKTQRLRVHVIQGENSSKIGLRRCSVSFETI